MTASPIPLAGSEAQLRDFLAHVVAIGRHRKTWTAADVARVAENLAPKRPAPKPPPPPRVVEQWQPPPRKKSRRVELTRGQARILTAVAADPGAEYREIAARLGMSAGSVANCASRAIRAIGAKTKAEAVVLVLTGEVVVETPPVRKRAA